MTTLATVLALSAPVAGVAQDSEAPAVDDGLSLGEDATGPAVGEAYTAEVNGDWELRCVKTATDTDPCTMFQLLTDAEDTPLIEVTLFKLPEGSRAVAGATIIVPLETALQQQLTIAVDTGAARRYPFSFCNTIGCYARVGLTAEDVTQFQRGAAATLSIVPAFAAGEKVEVSMSLTGFTASYDKVSVLQQ